MNISVECNTDHFILSHLLKKHDITGQVILHQRGKSGVLNRMKNNRGEIGIIDEDPEARRNPLLDEYHLHSSNDYFRTYRRIDDERSRLLMVTPFLEEVIVRLMGDESLEGHGSNIGTDPYYIHTLNPYKDIEYQEFLEKLLERSKKFDTIINLLELK